jgi:hypothetical protein
MLRAEFRKQGLDVALEESAEVWQDVFARMRKIQRLEEGIRTGKVKSIIEKVVTCAPGADVLSSYDKDHMVELAEIALRNADRERQVATLHPWFVKTQQEGRSAYS